ncbi:hypothetical protein QUA26_14265 [Microcoleus sp. Pol12A4]
MPISASIGSGDRVPDNMADYGTYGGLSYQSKVRSQSSIGVAIPSRIDSTYGATTAPATYRNLRVNQPKTRSHRLHATDQLLDSFG